MTKNLRRGAVALAIVFSCVAGMTNPASAWTALTGDITGGVATAINTTGTVTDNFFFGTGTGTTGTGCGVSLDIHLIAGAWSVSGFSYISRFTFGTNHYVGVTTKTTSTTLNFTGTVTSITTTSATLNTSGLNLRTEIYFATNTSSTATDCIHGTTRTCLFSSIALNVQGTYNGDWNNPATSHTVNLAEAGTLGATLPPCTAPFTTYTNGTVTVTGLTAHITSVT